MRDVNGLEKGKKKKKDLQRYMYFNYLGMAKVFIIFKTTPQRDYIMWSSLKIKYLVSKLNIYFLLFFFNLASNAMQKMRNSINYLIYFMNS